MGEAIELCGHLLDELQHGLLVFIGSGEDAELFVMVFCQPDDALDILFFVLHVIGFIICADQPYGTCAFVKCCVEFFDVVSCSDLHNM